MCVLTRVRALVCLLAFWQATDAAVYEWRTGDWGLCRHTDCGRGGQQTRRVWCVRPRAVTSHESHDQITSDDRCPSGIRPPDARECFHVCDFHRYQFHWDVPPWSECMPEKGHRRCEQSYGIQTRNITCVAKCGGPSPSNDVCESFTPKPPTEQVCEQKCPRDCIVGDFGAWTPCDTCWVRNSTRFRSVVAAPSNGGKPCMHLTETRPCSNHDYCNEYTSGYQYKLGNWTECLSYHASERRGSRGFTSVLGHRRRTVDCVNVRGILVDKKYCIHIKLPPSVQLCVLPRDCLVSHWSNWTSFSQSMPTPSSQMTLKRQRNVLQVPLGTGHVCPDLLQQRETKIAKPSINCNDYRWVRGNWGKCRLAVEGERCGMGVQSRPVLCLRSSDTVPVPDHQCAYEAPLHTRSCTIPCPQACLVSEWSAWGDCLKDKCRHAKNRAKTGYRVRTRSIIREGGYGGAPCLNNKEMQECTYPSCYSWRARATNGCVLKYPDMHCGEGRLNKLIECINLSGDVVSDRNCFEPRPLSQETCHLPCAQDCVTSEWTTWSTCSKTCGEGRTSGYMMRTREILANPVGDGWECPSIRNLLEKRRCNEYSCNTHHWDAGPWTGCRLVNAETCGNGRKERVVTCRDSHNEASQRCRLEEMPETVRNCTVSCPRNCVFSAFTDWSLCPVTCLKDDARTLPEQYRWRFVLEHPSRNGVPCPELKESRPCMNLPRCATYHWRESDWSQCMYATHYDNCGQGYRAREVRCLNDRDEILPEEICISQLGSMPEITESCNVANCDPDACKFSDWSAWTGCTQRCGGQRKRIRHMEGITNRIMACYDRKNYPLEDRQACSCPLFTIKQVGNWSSCILEDLTDPRTKRPDPDGYYNKTKKLLDSIGQLKPGFGHCGVGRRTQAIICQSHSLNVSAYVCDGTEFAEEMCFIACPVDCIMSQWTNWGSCETQERCGNGVRRRSRYQVESSLDGGRDCPRLVDKEEYQTEPCSVPCDQYGWVTQPWSECDSLKALAIGPNCGPGLQTRIVRCMKWDRHGDRIEIQESFCDPRTKPIVTEHCSVPCAGHCVTSHWGEWSDCSQGCKSNTTRHRTRSIRRQPQSPRGAACPQLQEIEYCQLGINCFRYHWSWSRWGVCVADKAVECGVGRRKRYPECKRNDGQPMPNKYCMNIRISPTDLISEESCEVHCPVDCVVSEWTEWTQCSRTCDLGYQTRSRKVLIHTAHRGRHCPNPLQQLRPCPFVECFHWAVSDWSTCHIEAGSCGFGTQTRNLSCVRHDGVAVDISLCPVEFKKHFELTQRCMLPCPGDCVLSEWSSWGPCHRPCGAPPNTEGFQSRSRVILAYPTTSGENCPSALWESRACRGGACPQYDWQTTSWYGDRRVVWCERSDKLRVYGGCKDSTKPAAIKDCSPKCIIPHAFCQDVNKCACEFDFQAIEENGALVWCEKMVSTQNNTGPEGEDVENQALFYPEDGPTNFWMYAVISAGSAFVIFVAVALYTIFKHSRKENARRASTGTMMKKRNSDASTNGTPLVQRPPPMTKIDSSYFEITEDKT